MKHTYLFEEGLWKAKGVFVDKNGTEFSVEGQATITHGEKSWQSNGSISVLTAPPTEFRNVYEIEPFESEQDCTKWSSQNPALGELIGNFVVIKDFILSIYKTKNNEFTGTEYLRQIDENLYQNCGVLMKGNIKISSWSVELKREDFA